MTPVHDTALIDLAYAASFVTLTDYSGLAWDKPLGEAVPAELERECYRLATQLGLTPLQDVEDLAALQETWRRQLKQPRQRDIFDIGMLLVRQHAIVIYLQCHPDAPEKPELCFVLDEIRQSLTDVFTHYKLDDAIAKLPVLPLPGAPDSWKTWSGDALRDTVVVGLGGSPE